MLKETIIGLAIIANTNVTSVGLNQPAVIVEKQVLASHDLDLTSRLPNSFGSEVFADNILLAIHFLKGDVSDLKSKDKISGPEDVDWDKARKPFEASFVLKPGEVFAYHKNVLPEFKDPVVTMNSRFFVDEGYKSLSGLGGNGVCHLASLINWVATDAGLEVTAKVNHDFYPVPGVPGINGTAILYAENGGGNSQNQNLYIKNNLNYSVKFVFKEDSKKVNLSIVSL